MKRQNKLKFVALDSNIFSYHFHKDPIFGPPSKKIFDLLSTDKLQAVTSLVTLIEILSIKAPPSKIKSLKESFFNIPGLVTYAD